MRAVDTNLVVRYLAGDDPAQAAKARAVIDGDRVFVATTVFLECEWVLRSVYGFASGEVAVALRRFAGLPTVVVEKPAMLAEALDRTEDGMDFADALHLGAAAGCEALLTFDQRFIAAAIDTPVEVMAP